MVLVQLVCMCYGFVFYSLNENWAFAHLGNLTSLQASLPAHYIGLTSVSYSASVCVRPCVCVCVRVYVSVCVCVCNLCVV